MAYEPLDLTAENAALENAGEVTADLHEVNDALQDGPSGYDDINHAYDKALKGIDGDDREARQVASNDHLDAVLTRAQNHDVALRLKEHKLKWEAPDHWDARTRQAYDRADPTVRAAMMEATALETPAKHLNAAWGQEMATTYGVDTATAANQALTRERQLRTGSEQERLAAYAAIGRDYGLDPAKAAQVAQQTSRVQTVIGERDRQWQDHTAQMVAANNEVTGYFAAHPDAAKLEGPMTEIANAWAQQGARITPAHLPQLHNAAQQLQAERDAIAQKDRAARARVAGSGIGGSGSPGHDGPNHDGSVEGILKTLM
ncbi:MAG: hypothetical protein OXD40_09460 [bacterium]|nr:hypothetical protein [bacterium]